MQLIVVGVLKYWIIYLYKLWVYFIQFNKYWKQHLLTFYTNMHEKSAREETENWLQSKVLVGFTSLVLVYWLLQSKQGYEAPVRRRMCVKACCLAFSSMLWMEAQLDIHTNWTFATFTVLYVASAASQHLHWPMSWQNHCQF